ncbi:PhzF family phenazine biosynthesis protein [Leisingera sp. ANG-Vp]|uniref:PhzF family phenazine biosynthesis protein n=1 Tax=Leisingera sp. ANG-Vp TaxID=1577896 RepID=UPI00057D2F00|nr:PhzF family phenazine biosynthesis protein [Leisingera sp. ANG-Vp]KIC20426.1 hypothetical protein RA20_08740 [Leisingera sp. ANG-Vp]
MQIPVYLVDAFADKPLTGNPAAVCPLDRWLPDAVMQSIAAEMNQSETVFFVPRGEGAGTETHRECDVRWFTPTREVDMIGHATLAAGHLLLNRLAPALEEIRFFSSSAEMSVHRENGLLKLQMPALLPAAVEEPDGLSQALGAKPQQVLAAKHYLAVFENADDVLRLRPDFDVLSKLPLPAVIVTAKSQGEDDFVSRFFAPANGVPEDSVSGVAHCCLATFWSSRLGKQQLRGRQLSSRGGTVLCHHDGAKVVLGGNAVVTLEGRISF